jgi:hypothetical protein
MTITVPITCWKQNLMTLNDAMTCHIQTYQKCFRQSSNTTTIIINFCKKHRQMKGVSHSKDGSWGRDTGTAALWVLWGLLFHGPGFNVFSFMSMSLCGTVDRWFPPNTANSASMLSSPSWKSYKMIFTLSTSSVHDMRTNLTLLTNSVMLMQLKNWIRYIYTSTE